VGAGDKACDLRETLVAGALILIAIGFDIDEMNLIAPLANQPRSRPDAWNRGNS
jgi:hypothetical protein